MFNLQFIWMTTSEQGTEYKKITKLQLDNAENNFITHNKVIVKSS